MSKSDNKSNLFHLKKGHRYKVKELFKQLSEIIKKKFKNKTSNISLLDAGCASGELSHFLKKDLRTRGRVVGFDISQQLVRNANDRFPDSNIDFYQDDIETFNLDQKFDVITATSILSYFTDPKTVLENILKHLEPKGIALISGIYNNWNLDVEMRFRFDDSDEWSDVHVINQFSKNRMRKRLASMGYKCTFVTQVMPFDIPRKKEPVRSWTVRLDGKRHMMNGLQLVYNIQTMIISKE